MINDEREEDRVIITRRRMVMIVRILMMMLMIDQPTARGVSVEMASFDSRCHDGQRGIAAPFVFVPICLPPT